MVSGVGSVFAAVGVVAVGGGTVAGCWAIIAVRAVVSGDFGTVYSARLALRARRAAAAAVLSAACIAGVGSGSCVSVCVSIWELLRGLAWLSLQLRSRRRCGLPRMAAGAGLGWCRCKVGLGAAVAVAGRAASSTGRDARMSPRYFGSQLGPEVPHVGEPGEGQTGPNGCNRCWIARRIAGSRDR